MDLAYFFAGTQSKEETSSAILATLLQHDLPFRASFLNATGCSPSLDPSAAWTIRVEDDRTDFRRFDVTLQSETTTVVIENKLSPGARRAGQLLEYYRACREHWSDHRLVMVYLAPETSWGEQQVADVLRSIADRSIPAASGPDWSRCITWSEVEDIIQRLPTPRSWFATSGIASIKDAISLAARRVVRDWTPAHFREAAMLGGPSAVAVVERALTWLEGRGLTPVFGRGETGPLYLALPRGSGDIDPVRLVKVYVPDGSVNLSYRRIAGAAPFDSVDRRVDLIRRLNRIPGAAPISEAYATVSESSYFSNEVLMAPGALAVFFGVLDWVADEIHGRTGSW